MYSQTMEGGKGKHRWETISERNKFNFSGFNVKNSGMAQLRLIKPSFVSCPLRDI